VQFHYFRTVYFMKNLVKYGYLSYLFIVIPILWINNDNVMLRYTIPSYCCTYFEGNISLTSLSKDCDMSDKSNWLLWFHWWFWFCKRRYTYQYILSRLGLKLDRLCGLVVRVPGYRSRGPMFDSWRYHIFWEVVGQEQGPLSLVRIIEELIERKSSGSGQENRINGRGDLLRWSRDTLYPQKLALTSPTSGCRSVSIVRLRTKGHGVLGLNLNWI
jgi:hypothetical protein